MLRVWEMIIVIMREQNSICRDYDPSGGFEFTYLKKQMKIFYKSYGLKYNIKSRI
jgi:hypothetical protein